MEINTAGGGTTTAIVEVPGMPASCGPSLPCVSLMNPAFAIRNSRAVTPNASYSSTIPADGAAKWIKVAGLPFKSATTVTFGSATQTSIDAAGPVGAGRKMTAVGGFVLNTSGIPRTRYRSQHMAEFNFPKYRGPQGRRAGTAGREVSRLA